MKEGILKLILALAMSMLLSALLAWSMVACSKNQTDAELAESAYLGHLLRCVDKSSTQDEYLLCKISVQHAWEHDGGAE